MNQAKTSSMAALLVVITILTSICCCKSITCYNYGREAGNGLFCYCLPGTDGENCEKTVKNWSTINDGVLQSTTRTSEVAAHAVDGLYESISLTRKERYPWWRIDLGLTLKVGNVQVIPFRTTKWGYDSLTMSWRVLVGVTSAGRYRLCVDDDERQDCKGVVGHLVVIIKRASTSELAYLGFREVVVYGKLSSVSPCLSNPCANGGSCKPKRAFFHMCVCPATWPGLNCEGKNWARGQNATISGPNGTVIAASNTVDGNRDDVMRRGNNIDNQCVTTTRDVTSPWWEVELETTVEVIQVYMVTRVESCTTDLLYCDVYVGPHNGTYTKYYDHSRDKSTPSGAEFYRWFYVWCLPVSIGTTVKIEYTYKRTVFESSFYAILSLCEVEVYGHIRPCASNPCHNGGTCNLNDTSYVCFCPAAWTGINCEQKTEVKVKGMPTSTKVLIGAGAVVGVVAVASGAAVTGSGWFTAGAAAHSGDVVSKFGGIALSKAIREGISENVMAIFDDEEDDGDGEAEGYSVWDAVRVSVTSLVQEASDAINPDPAETVQQNA